MRKSFPLVVSLAVIWSAAAIAQVPPQNLHWVEDHWTAWDPPAAFPEGAELYTVRDGDTLWDLAERFYGNPYLWPQLWERNRYVLDAHWIYPGDPLVVGVEVVPIDQLADSSGAEGGAGSEGSGSGAGEGAGAGDESGLRLDRSVEPPVPLGFESDITCSGFIADLDRNFDHVILGSEYQALMPDLTSASRLGAEGAYGTIDTLKVDLATGDIVYLDGGMAAGLVPGSLYSVVKPQERVLHPETGDLVGRFYRFSGRVRVLSVQEETAIAEIVQTCMPINVGDGLEPYAADPVPLARRGLQVGFNDPLSESALAGAPVIIRAESQVYSIGQDHVVYVDRGAGSVTPGEIYTIYRRNREGLPPVVIGELGILKAHENSSVAKVIESRYTVYVGDRLALKP